MPAGKFNTSILEAEARTFNTSILADEVDMTPEDTARAQIQAEEERPDLTFGRIFHAPFDELKKSVANVARGIGLGSVYAKPEQDLVRIARDEMIDPAFTAHEIWQVRAEIEKYRDQGYDFKAAKSMAMTVVAQKRGRNAQEVIEAHEKHLLPDLPTDDEIKAARARSNKKSAWLDAVANSKYLEMDPELEQSSGLIEDLARAIGTSIMPMMAMWANPILGTHVMYEQIKGAKYEALVRDGVDEERANLAASRDAVPQTALEFIGNMFVLKTALGGKRAWAKVVTDIAQASGAEGITEFAQQYPDELSTYWAMNPDMTIQDAWKEMTSLETLKRAAYAGVIGAAAGGIMAGAGHGINRALDRYVLEPQRKKNEEKLNLTLGAVKKLKEGQPLTSDEQRAMEGLGALPQAFVDRLYYQTPVDTENRDKVYDGLLKSNITKEQADATITVIDAIAHHYAEVTGQTPEAFYDVELTDYRVGKFDEFNVDQERQAAQARTQFQAAAFHGSPHTFDKFSTDYIGTGEGAQAYGHGLYFAGKKEVADFYRKKLSGPGQFSSLSQKLGNLKIGNDSLLDKYDIDNSEEIIHLVKDKDTEGIKEYIDRNIARWSELSEDQKYRWRDYAKDKVVAYKNLKQSIDSGAVIAYPEGHLYEVELAPEEDEYLLWDKPLSEQSEKVKEAIEKTQAARLENNYDAEKIREDFEENGPLGYSADRFDRVLDEAVKYGGYGSEFGADVWAELEEAAPNSSGYIRDLKKASFKNTLDPNVDTGESIYKGLASEKGGDRSASDYLHSLGIRGIRYLDAASRGKGEGHYNYVIFSDKDVSITEMYSVEKILNNPVGYKKAAKEISGTLKDKIRNETHLLLQEIAYQVKPDIHRLGNLKKFLTSPEWYEHPVFSRIVRLFTRDREELFNEYYNHLTNLEQPMMEENTVGELALKLKHKGLSLAQRLAGESSKEYQDLLKIIDEGDIYNVVYSEDNLKKQGYSEDTIAAWRGFRESYDKALDLMTAQMNAMIEAIEEEAAFKGVKPVDYSEMYQTLKGAVAMMGQLRGSYAPRTRQGNWAVTAYRGDEENREYYREHRYSHLAAKRLAKKLESEGWTISRIGEVERLPEDVYQDLKTVSVAKAIETAIDNMTKGKGSITQNQAVKFNEELLQEVADMIRARGFRSSMIKRGKGSVVKGYIEDPIERHAIYTSNVSRGLAKAKVAGRAMEEFAGKNVKGELVGGINPQTEPQIYSAAKDYIEEQLRNLDKSDRTIAWAKSLATLKFLGFSARAALVNMTAIVTTAPASIHQYVMNGKAPLWKVNKALALAGKDAAKFMAGKELTGDDMTFLVEEKRKGWDNPQYTRDMISKIGSTGNRAWAMTMDGAMWMFGKTEQWNRLTTMLAAYRLAREAGKNHPQASELAKTASDKAHGIYGRSTLPSIAWGRNPAAKIAQMLYVFSKFAHNYMQMLYDLGFRKHNWKAFSYALLAPIFLSGVSAWPLKDAVFMPLIGVLLSILGIKDRDRDTEKWLWDITRNNLGSGAERIGRYGALGGLGFDVSGSLSIGVGLPRDYWEWGGAIGGVAKEGMEALRELGQGNVGRAAEKMLPAGLANPVRAWREAEEGITTRNKRRVWDESGRPFVPMTGETARRALGFRSPRQAVLSQRTWEGHRQQAHFTEMRNDIYEKFRAWLLSGGKDRARYAQIIKEARDYNAKIRDLGIMAEVPPITTQSMRSQMKRTQAPTKRERALLM